LSEVASRGPILDARWTMSLRAARAFMTGRGVARGLGVPTAVGLGVAGVGPTRGAADVILTAGEELLDEEPGSGAVHATVSTKSRSAAAARRISRPYVGLGKPFTRLPEGPSGSQDA
jgi:hypothetical protein